MRICSDGLEFGFLINITSWPLKISLQGTAILQIYQITKPKQEVVPYSIDTYTSCVTRVISLNKEFLCLLDHAAQRNIIKFSCHESNCQ